MLEMVTRTRWCSSNGRGSNGRRTPFSYTASTWLVMMPLFYAGFAAHRESTYCMSVRIGLPPQIDLQRFDETPQPKKPDQPLSFPNLSKSLLLLAKAARLLRPVLEITTF